MGLAGRLGLWLWAVGSGGCQTREGSAAVGWGAGRWRGLAAGGKKASSWEVGRGKEDRWCPGGRGGFCQRRLPRPIARTAPECFVCCLVGRNIICYAVFDISARGLCVLEDTKPIEENCYRRGRLCWYISIAGIECVCSHIF